MNKRLPAVLALALPVTAIGLMGLTERVARADVIPICIPLDGVPECNDGDDNDFDGLVDLMDSGCASSTDHAEGIAGYQGAPCQHVEFILWEQFLRAVPWPPDCPECGLTLIDIRQLLIIPPEQLIRGVNPQWEVSVHKKLQQPVQGVFDDPNIPNLRLRYKGNKLLPPGSGGKLFEFLAAPELNIRYLGRAYDARTGKLVNNSGVLNPQQ